MGGHGWTEHCSKCMKAKDHGWKQAANSPHSDACRIRIEGELAQTERGRARLANTQQRSERWLESSVAADVDHASAEGEIQPAAADDSPPKFLPMLEAAYRNAPSFLSIHAKSHRRPRLPAATQHLHRAPELRTTAPTRPQRSCGRSPTTRKHMPTTATMCQ